MARKPPPRAKTNLSHVTARNTVQARLLADYALLQDWKAVGAKNGVSGGMAYRVAAQSYEPRNTAIRARLGFPALAPAPVCPVHGVVHARTCRQVPAWVARGADFLAQRERQ
jgi:hypothetical protein